nr:MAG TPA: head maturation protease [Caudoviricetes sp.]
MTNSTSLEWREYKIALAENDTRTLEGLAVPYERETKLAPGYYETIARDAYQPDGGVGSIKLLWRHGEVIGAGTATSGHDGVPIQARISQTSAGDDAYQLLLDGVVDSLSIGFIPLEYEETWDDDQNLHVRQKRIDIKEVSLVPWPAYDDAKVTKVREQTQKKEGNKVDNDTLENELARLRNSVNELRTMVAAPHAAPTVDRRCAAEIVKALVAGDGKTLEDVNSIQARAWSGTTSAADPIATGPHWVADLTRIYDQPDALKPLFAVGDLPSEGMRVDHTYLKLNSITVNKQVNEGDDLVLGKVELQSASTPVGTYGGYTSLSRQTIERASVNVLQRHLEAMAVGAGAVSRKALAAAWNKGLKDQEAASLVSTKAASALTWADLSALVVDAAAYFAKQNLPLDGLVVNMPTFKALAALTAGDRPLLAVGSDGSNTAGGMNLVGISGDLAGLKIVCDLNAEVTNVANIQKCIGGFYSRDAIRIYESGLVQLQETRAINLTDNYSVYRYAAYANEIQGGVLPLKLG